MYHQFAFALASLIILAGCGTSPALNATAGKVGGLTAQRLTRGDKAPADFTGLEVAIEKRPVRCPCFTLTAKNATTTVVVEYEGFSTDYAIDKVTVNGKAMTAEQKPRLVAALIKAAAEMKNKDEATTVENVAGSIK